MLSPIYGVTPLPGAIHAVPSACFGSEDSARWPVSRVLSPRTSRGGRPFIWDTRYRVPHATDPGDRRENTPCKITRTQFYLPPLLGLAPGGVYRAVTVAGHAVRSYRTLSPLPARTVARSAGGLLSVALSLGSPPPGVTRHRVSVEPGLSSNRRINTGQRPPGRLTLRAW